jgi:hypothetical protein
MDLEYLQSQCVQRIDEEESICQIVTPRGEKIPLTAEQIVHAKVEQHGNFGQSRIKVTLNIEIQADGNAEYYRDFFAKCLLAAVQKQRKEISTLKTTNIEQHNKILQLESDARAADVVESAMIAIKSHS